jgi:hypothetical protein
LALAVFFGVAVFLAVTVFFGVVIFFAVVRAMIALLRVDVRTPTAEPVLAGAQDSAWAAGSTFGQ